MCFAGGDVDAEHGSIMAGTGTYSFTVFVGGGGGFAIYPLAPFCPGGWSNSRSHAKAYPAPVYAECVHVAGSYPGIADFFDVVQYWHVAILAFLLGTIHTIDMPARQSFIIELVGREDLMNAIALNSFIFNAARIIGPAVAGLVITYLGIAACFFLNAASFVFVLGGLLLMRLEHQAAVQEEQVDVLKDIREGLGYIRRTPIVFSTAMNFNVLVPVFAREVLHREAQGFGFLMSAMGVGAFLGALTLAYFSHRGPRP